MRNDRNSETTHLTLSLEECRINKCVCINHNVSWDQDNHRINQQSNSKHNGNGQNRVIDCTTT